jgi:hypothetical protein
LSKRRLNYSNRNYNQIQLLQAAELELKTKELELKENEQILDMIESLVLLITLRKRKLKQTEKLRKKLKHYGHNLGIDLKLKNYRR